MNYAGKIGLLLFVQIVLQTIAFCQPEKTHRLQKAFPAGKDTNHIDNLNALSYAYTFLEKKDSALYFATQACEEAKMLNYIHGIAVAFTRKSIIAKHFDDDFVTSERLGKTALYWYQKTGNNEGIDTLYTYLTYAVFSQSRFEEAIQYSEKEYVIAKQHNNQSVKLDALAWMFAIYRQSGSYEKSFLYAQKRYDLAIKANNKIWISNALYGMAELYMLIEDYPDAMAYFRRVLQMDDKETRIERENTDTDIWFKMEFTEVFSHLGQFDSAWHYYNLYKPSKKQATYLRVYWVSTGECYFLQKDYPHALQNLQLGLAEHKKLNDRNEVMRTLLDISKTYLALGNTSASLQYAQEGLSIALAAKAKQYVRDGYQILYSVYDHWGQKDSANFYFRQYTAMKDAVANDQIKAKFAAYKYDQQIELLNKEKQLQQDRLRQASLQRKFMIAAIGSILLLMLFAFLNISLKRKNETSRRKIIEMQALRAQMNPHFIFNSLNSINRFILENDKAQASAYLIKFSKLVRLILQNSQLPLITLENELEALQLYLDLEAVRFNHQFEFSIITTEALDISALKVPPLIIQPYAENAIWHGLLSKIENGHLTIELFEANTMLCCKITDDGIGRKKAAELKGPSVKEHRSMGMRITAERIAMMQQNKQLDACIKVTDLVLADGSPGGTEVLLKFPLLYA